MDLWINHITDPVSPATFLKAFEVWSTAATQPLRKPAKPRAPGLYLTDIPLNRSGMAVTAYLRKIGIDRSQPFLYRLMNLGKVLSDKAVTEAHTKSADDPREMMISDSLVKALAVAKISADGNFNIPDVMAHAARFDAETASQ